MTLVVDTSAVLAIVFGEPEAPNILKILGSSTDTFIAAGTAVELFRLVHIRIGLDGWADLERLFTLFAVVTAAMDEDQLELAKDGMRRFGKGRGAPPAVLNFGDLFAYALTRKLSAPLLFKGNDFGQTDIIPAWTP